MQAVSNFVRYYRNRFGLHRSFIYAFGVSIKDALLGTLLVLLCGAALYGVAYAVIHYGIKDAEAKVEKQQSYVRTLETWLANCMSPYYEFTVGDDEKWICGAVMRWEPPKGD